jgi:hypothetical protein
MRPDGLTWGGMARLALMAAVVIILAGCGSGAEGAKCGGRRHTCVTWAHVRRIKIGMSAKAAFRLLDARPSGGQRFVQPFEYLYPVWGTGTGDPEGVGEGGNSSYSWFGLCVQGRRVVDTSRHKSRWVGCLAMERREFVLAKRRAKRSHSGALPPEFRTEAAWLEAGKPRG